LIQKKITYWGGGYWWLKKGLKIGNNP
jgi:hypothetical protein